jgi:hypothetical protein
MARSLAPSLVSDDLAAALRAGTAVDLADYAGRADALLAPHRVEALRRTVAEEVLPALGISSPRSYGASRRVDRT